MKLKGTTTVGLVTKEGVVLAADKRVTLGHLNVHSFTKIYPLTNQIAITTSGVVGDNQSLIRWLSSELKLFEIERNREPTVSVAANLLSNIFFSYRMSPFPILAHVILAGRDNGEYKLYVLTPDGSFISDKYAATGSGSELAYSILDNGYKDNITLKEAQALAVKAINTAMKRDIYSGNNIDLVVIDKNGFKRIEESEINKLLK